VTVVVVSIILMTALGSYLLGRLHMREQCEREKEWLEIRLGRRTDEVIQSYADAVEQLKRIITHD